MGIKRIFIALLFSSLLLTAVFLSGCTLINEGGTGMFCKTRIEHYSGCDKAKGCKCLHRSWGGLGSCDTCECEDCMLR